MEMVLVLGADDVLRDVGVMVTVPEPRGEDWEMLNNNSSWTCTSHVEFEGAVTCMVLGLVSSHAHLRYEGDTENLTAEVAVNDERSVMAIMTAITR